MPKSTIIRARVVDCNEKTLAVLKAYDKAIAEWGAEYKSAANSSNLTSGEEKNVKGGWATLKRGLGIKEGTKTCDLVEIEVTIEGTVETYYKEFELDLINELDKAILSSLGKKPENITSSERLKNSEEISKMEAGNIIRNHNYLIYLLILRIVAVALSDEFQAVDRKIEELEIKGFMKLLKNFINNLVSNPSIFVTSNLFVEDYVSTFGIFLGRKIVTRWLIPLNILIEHSKFKTAPRTLLSEVGKSLGVVEVALQTYETIVINEIYYILSSTKWFGGTKLIRSGDQLYAKVSKTLIDFLDLTLQKIESYATSLETEQKDTIKTNLNECVSSKKTPVSIQSRRRFESIDDHEQRLKQDRLLKEIIIVKLQKILVHYKGPDKLKNNLQRYIEELRSLFDLHDKLILIKEAVAKFIEITKSGGWFPILLGIVQPRVLNKAIQNFSTFCEPVEARCGDLIENISDSIVIRGMIRVPTMELETLRTRAKELDILQTRKAQTKVKNELRFEAAALFNLHHHFKSQGLLTDDELFIAEPSIPSLGMGNSVQALIQYTARRSEVKATVPQNTATVVPQVCTVTAVPK